MTDYTIVIADDHTLIREGVRNLINGFGGFNVIGEAADGISLLKLLKKRLPDMVIMDISMPGLRGIEATREIHIHYPAVRILILSMHKNHEFLSMSLEAGAHGYLLKEDTSEELLEAINRLRSGHTYLSARVAAELSTEILDICKAPNKKKPDALTHREREVLKLISEGYTDRQISGILYISFRTVQRHRFNIREKLKLKHTADLVKYAIGHGYTSE